MTRMMLLIALVACTKPAGGPLKYTFDAAKLASVSLDAKQQVAEAQQQHELAQLEHAKADDAYRDSEIEVELAEYQAQNAIVVSQLAAATKPAAANVDLSALARKAAEAKVAFEGARRAWLDKLASSSLYEMYAAQAKLELARAKLAQANNLVPAGFDVAAYERQATDRAAAAQTASAETAQQRAAAEAKLATWNEAEHAVLQASGLTAPTESDRVAAEWKAPAPADKPAEPKAEPPTPEPAAADPGH